MGSVKRFRLRWNSAAIPSTEDRKTKSLLAKGGTMIMMTSRLSRCHQTPGLVAAKEFLFQQARGVSVMVRG
jgi:hypothetical protein